MSRDSDDGFRFDTDSGFEEGESTDDASDVSGASDTDSGSSGPALDAPDSLSPDSSSSESLSPDSSSSESPSSDRIRAALAEVRREVQKAAVVQAAVEAALVALVANLALTLFEPSALAGAVGLPAVAVEPLRALPLLGEFAPRTVQVASFVAVAAGLVAFAASLAHRLRRPLVEQFESANPVIEEALRTARDAVDGGSDTEMARRLYDDVVETLGETSSLDLVDARRVAATVLLVALVSLASVQVAIVNPDVSGLLGGSGDAGVQQPDDDELQDGDQILGDREDVEAGDDLENISVPGTGEGEGGGPTGPSDGFGGGGGSGEFDSQQAGFAGEERIEDAELVREYNLRIRELDEERDGGATT
ncbi:DUF7502 family protein [Halobellus sp. GM3]|uniref:DUF7502 family protein n=1 Tax=Halobellus sp. GM3 TaxID=3458410 RepID=UPI00403D7DB9